MACLGLTENACALSLATAGRVVNRTAPRVGFVSSAARRSRVVFPAPLGPRSATNSPGRISSETPRNAASEPKRFSTLSNDTPMDAWGAAVCVASTGNASRLASHQVAEGFFDADTFAGVVLFADGAGLAAQFEAEDVIFEIVQAALDLIVNIGDGFYPAAWDLARRGRRNCGDACCCDLISCRPMRCRVLRGARCGRFRRTRRWHIDSSGPCAVARSDCLGTQPKICETEDEDGNEASGEYPFEAVQAR